MFRALRNFWDEYVVLIRFISLVWIIVGLMIYGAQYFHSRQTFDVGDNIEVKVVGPCWYLNTVPETGKTNQFYASNELGYSSNSMEPRFILVNRGDEPRDVNVHTFTGYRTPITGTLHLEPGQRVELQFQAHYKWWYCWINPVPKKSS
jgi:hypothetical protein